MARNSSGYRDHQRGGKPASVALSPGATHMPNTPDLTEREVPPLALDLYCGQGGAGEGYRRAGFAVLGVDILPQPRYPFAFVQADALEFLAFAHLGGVSLIHASPPCRNRSKARALRPVTGPDLIAPTRVLLEQAGIPWVIENVPPSGTSGTSDPIRPDLKLCGCMFGLRRLQRQRWFETSWHAFDLRAPCHHTERAISVTRHGGPATNWGTHEERLAAMGIDWMTADGLGEAIPPAYTEYIGLLALAHFGWQGSA